MPTEEDRYEAYKICRLRGHQPSNMTLGSMPPLNVCKWCGTQYRYEQRLIEQNLPKAPLPDNSLEDETVRVTVDPLPKGQI